jgi:uncharacterized membrane protein
MKFHPTWQQVSLLAVLFAAIIISHLVAPLAVSVITSIVSTIVGALFVNLRGDDPVPEEVAKERGP